MRKTITLLLMLTLGATAMARHDFGVSAGGGNTLYYKILADSASVAVVYPAANGYYWVGYTQPSGSIAIPSSVTWNGRSYSVKTIEIRAFANCDGLTAVEIGDSVEQIANHAFSNCTNLRNVSFGSQLSTLGASSFEGCIKLESVVLPSRLTTIGNYAFSGCTSLVSATLGRRTTNAGDGLFSDCTSLHEVGLGTSLLEVSDYMFSGCTALESVAMPNTVTRIGNYAFNCCTSLQHVTTSTLLRTVDEYAFYCCGTLQELSFGDSLRTVGEQAFYLCTALNDIILGKSVSSIGDKAFSNCSQLRRLRIKAITPPEIATRAFDQILQSIRLVVPCGCMEAYTGAAVWRSFADYTEEACNLLDIDNADDTPCRITSQDGTLVVEGSQDERVAVYSLDGRPLLIGRTTNPMRATLGRKGLVLVTVGQRPAIKVLIH